MDDLDKYINQRIRNDPEFAEGFDSGYTKFKLGYMLAKTREESGILQRKLAQQLSGQGYKVNTEPSRTQLPFDLGSYIPDLIATKNDQGIIVEVTDKTKRSSIDRFLDLAEIVASHQGWCFILVLIENKNEEIAQLPLEGKTDDVQYVSDAQGNNVAVIVPIKLWQELTQKDDTDYLLSSETMKERLLTAKNRQTGISLEEACEKLGI